MNTLYTFGYAGASLEDFAKLVVRNGWYVIDTRMLPRSRRPEWNSKRIRETLGAQYMHHIELGNVNYKSGGEIKLNDPDMGLIYVKDALRTHEVVLLCGCKVVDECHRKVIAELVQQQTGCKIVHLTVDDLKRQPEISVGEPLELKSQTVREQQPKPQPKEMFSAAEVAQPAPMSSIWGDKRPPLVLISETVPVDRDEEIQPKLL